MRRPLLLCSTVLACFAPGAFAQNDAKPKPAVPQWIWTSNPAKETVIYARRVFTLNGNPKRAKLTVTCDNGFTAFINGKKLGSGNEWSNRYEFALKKHLNAGDNVLAIEATNEGSVAGLVAKIELTSPDGKSKRTIVTDKEWHVSPQKREGWQAPSINTNEWQTPVVVGALGAQPWGNVFADARKATPASVNSGAKVHPKGFEIEKIYDVPKGEQGSWVSMAVDDKGRLYCSDQGKQGIFRITLGKNTPQVEKVPVEISGAHGLLWAFDSLYVCVNGGGVGGHGSGLYKLTDTDADDQLDKVLRLRGLEGGGEHGPHAVVLSPDKKSLFVLGGNHTKPPKTDTSAVPGYQEDQLLPRSPDARGHAASIRAPGGWIAQTDPSGETWNFFCSGFRNQYDVAFNADGELFTYDSDMEWDSGMPWYRPTRIYHCTSGAEFGWRTGTGKWPAWYPDCLPPVLDIGPGSPTGVLSGEGAKFPAKYQQAIYAFDWTYGTIYAIHLVPTGSTYSAVKEEFITGVPLNVSDGVIGKDGNFYFAVGGRGTPSALYRVSYSGTEPTYPAFNGSKLGSTERNLRREIERFHGKEDPAAVEAVWPHLGHPDRFIRYAARVAVEHQPVTTWRERALGESNTQAGLTALLALTHKGEASDLGALLNQISELMSGQTTEAQKLEALRVMSLAFIRFGKPDEGTASEVVTALLPYYPAPSDALNRELVAMLTYLDAPEAVTRTVPLLSQEAVGLEEIEFDDKLLNRSAGYGKSFMGVKESNPQRQQIHYVYALKNATTGWTPELRKQYFTWFAKAQNFKGGASFEGFLKNFRNESLENVPDEAERKAMDELSKAKIPLVPEGFENAEKLTIGTLANMKYDKETLTAKAGTKVAIVLVNTDPMKLMHNLAVCAPGSIDKVIQAAITIGPKAIEMNFIPDIPEVLAATPQVAPGRQYTLYLDVPNKAGDYPYVCTYPGHGILMRGILKVTE